MPQPPWKIVKTTERSNNGIKGLSFKDLLDLNSTRKLQESLDKANAAPQTIQSLISGIGKNPPVGTSISAGSDAGRVTYPVNRNLTSDEINAVTAKNVFAPTGEDIKQKVKGGVFNSQYGNIGRTYRQYAAGQPNALMTSYDPNLQALQGKINSIRRYVFGEGGKQLTPYEGKVVMALLTPLGKSDQQYGNDIDDALKLIESKASLALGGVNAANQIPEAPGNGQGTITVTNGKKTFSIPKDKLSDAQARGYYAQ